MAMEDWRVEDKLDEMTRKFDDQEARFAVLERFVGKALVNRRVAFSHSEYAPKWRTVSLEGVVYGVSSAGLLKVKDDQGNTYEVSLANLEDRD